MRPVADMIRLLSERVADFIANPREWRTPNLSEEAYQSAVNRVAQEVYSRLHAVIADRLFHDHLHEWIGAYSRSGQGSTQTRAMEIRNIYEIAAPVPGELPTKDTMGFLDVMRKLFKDAAISAGAEVIG